MDWFLVCSDIATQDQVDLSRGEDSKGFVKVRWWIWIVWKV
jgi:hypothetical protein